MTCLVFGKLLKKHLPEMEKFSSKSKLISVLIFMLSEISELCELSRLLGILDLIGLGVGPVSWTWMEGTYGIKGLVCVTPSSALFMKFTGSVEFTQFVFLVSIFVSPGIFCDSSDGGIMV